MLFGYKFTEGGPWSEETIKSVIRFAERVEKIVGQINCENETNDEIQFVRANTIKSVREDLESFSFNTAVARCMEFLNAISSAKDKSRESITDLVLLVAPMMPHFAEEFYERIGSNGKSIFDQKFPSPNKKFLERSTVEIAVQINSKIKSKIMVKTNASQDDVEELAMDVLDGQKPKKVIYIPNRLINFIV